MAPKVLDRDVQALSAGAWAANVDLFVFSNELALEGRYLRFDHRTRSAVMEDMPRAPEDGNPVLSLWPLARPQQFRAALQAVKDTYPGMTVEMALIANSHGADDIPLMPRVNLDFTKVNPKAIINELDGGSSSDLALPETVLQGTSQQQFWSVLGDVGAGDSVRYPLVFLSSCQSGPLEWREFFAIPESVDRIAHLGIGSVMSAAIDYHEILQQGGQAPKDFNQIVQKLSSGLPGSGGQPIIVESRLSILQWPLAATLQSAPLSLYAIPLAAFLFWLGASALGWPRWRAPRRSARLAAQ